MAKSLVRSLTANWIGQAVNVAVGIVVPAMVVRSLGTEQYGVWALAVSIAGHLSILDLGTRHAIVRYVAQYRSVGDSESIAKILSSNLALLAVLSWIGIVAMAGVAIALPYLFTVSPESLFATRVLLLVLAVDAACDLLSGPFSSALGAVERYDLLQALNSGRLILNGILVGLSVWAGWGLIGVAAALLVSRLLYRIMLAVSLRRVLPDVSLSRRHFDSGMVRQIVSFSAWSAVMVTSYRLSYQFDLVVIGTVLGAVAVTSYAFPLLLIDQLRAVCDSAALVLFSRLSSVSKEEWAQEGVPLLDRWARYAPLLPLTVGLHLAVFGGNFITLWIGEAVPEAQMIITLLVIPFFITAPTTGYVMALLARSRPSVAALLQCGEGVINIVLSVILVRSYGLVGVALGTCIAAIFVQGVFTPLVAAGIAEYKWSAFAQRAFVRCLPLLIVYTGVLLVSRAFFGSSTIITFLLANGVPLLVFLTVLYRFYLPSEDRDYVLRRFRKPCV
jgi:O-antigen/teichoic acid export membrane protein